MPNSISLPHDIFPLYVAVAPPAPRAIRSPPRATPPYGFAVNDQCFYEDTFHEDQTNKYIEFEVHIQSERSRKTEMESRFDMNVPTPTDSDPDSDSEDNTPLLITLQKVPGGCIINSEVYLSDLQYHTLVNVDGKLVKCAVCDLYSDIDTMHQHAAGDAHEKNMQRYPPLNKFDISITRKIADTYHCGVCNQLYNCNKMEDHLDAKMHEGNLLFAINKTADILYNFHGQRDIYTEEKDRENGLMYRTYNTGDGAANKDCYYFNINNIRDNESVSSDSCYNDNNEFINYQNEFRNDMMMEYEEPELPITGISYAKMAKKPKIETQDYIVVDYMDNKKVTVRFDSWHMIIRTKPNRFHCMVCNKQDHIRHKTEHCSRMDHLDKLQKFAVVVAYEDYFIRQVDDKLCHCGHCNNLQLIHEIEDHIESTHPRPNKLHPVKQTPVKQTPVKQTPVKQTPVKQTPVKQIPVKTDNIVKRDNNDNKSDKARNTSRPATPVKNAVTNANAYKSLNFGSPVKSDNCVKYPVISDKYPVNSDNYPANYDKYPANCDKYPTNCDKFASNAQSLAAPVRNASNPNPIYKTPNVPAVKTNNVQPAKTFDASDNQIVTYVKSNTNHQQNPNQSDNHDCMNNKNNDLRIRDINIRNLDLSQIFKDIEISPFGCTMLVPMLSYNVILKRNTEFYCGLCDYVCGSGAIKNHICEIRHMELLQRTPFIVYFKYHLIRAIRETFHCTICNINIKSDIIMTHSKEPIHVGLLIKHLKYKPKALNQRTDFSAKEIQGTNNSAPHIIANVPKIAKTAHEMVKTEAEYNDAKNIYLSSVENQPVNRLAYGENNMVQGTNNLAEKENMSQIPNILHPQNTSRNTQYSYVRPKETPIVNLTQESNQLAPFTAAPKINHVDISENMATGINTNTSHQPNMPKVFSVKHTAPSMNNYSSINSSQGMDVPKVTTTQDLTKVPNIPRAVTKMAHCDTNIFARPVTKSSNDQNVQSENKPMQEVNSQSINNNVIPKVADFAVNVASFIGQTVAKYAPSYIKNKGQSTVSDAQPKDAIPEDAKTLTNTANSASNSNNTSNNQQIKKLDVKGPIPKLLEMPFVMPDLTRPPPNMAAFMNNHRMAPILPHTAPAAQLPNLTQNTTKLVQSDTKLAQRDTKDDSDDEESEDEEYVSGEEGELIEEEGEVVEENEKLDATFESMMSEDATFDNEEYLYLKLKNSYIKISSASYNTLVHIADGSRFCFVCSEQVDYFDLQKHVDTRSHLQRLDGFRFVDKYEDHLLRQNFLEYHCAICNVIVSQKVLRTHLEWPEHALLNENTFKNIKKQRKNEIKGGVKHVVVCTQKENIYLNVKEVPVKLFFNVTVNNKPNKTDDKAVKIDVVKKKVAKQTDEIMSKTVKRDGKSKNAQKKNKIIIFNDMVLKVSWESWHGVCEIRSGYKCNLCQKELKANEMDAHCDGEWHKYSLAKQIEKQYAPALIRKINESTLNCVVCNTELSNKSHLVAEHVNGKRHVKNYEAILADSSKADVGYDDCDEDVFTIN